jgi:1-aminocyclopropane-1-carboxylate deaminase
MNLPTPIEALLLNGAPYHQVFVKRDDLIDPVISGNKWRKLKYHLQAFEQSNKTNIRSFGGAYSNHLHALAKLCFDRNIKVSAWIRGHELTAESNPTLADIDRWGMQMNFISREQYKQRFEHDYLQQLQSDYPESYIIPEGGYALEAIDGCREIIAEIASDLTSGIETNTQQPFEHIVVAVGSGATAAGIVLETAIRYPNTKVHGICAVKNGGYLQQQIQQLIEQYMLCSKDCKGESDVVKMTVERTVTAGESLKGEFLNGVSLTKKNPKNTHITKIMQQLTLHTEYHFGGFAKQNADFKQAIRDWLPHFNIEFDSVYNGKALLAVKHLIEIGQIPKEERVLLIHTGGLQGKR